MSDRREKIHGILSSLSIYLFPILLCLFLMQAGCSSESGANTTPPSGETTPPQNKEDAPSPPDDFKQGQWKSLPANPEPPTDHEQIKVEFLENSHQIRQAHVQIDINEDATDEIQMQLAPLEQKLHQLQSDKSQVDHEISNLESERQQLQSSIYQFDQYIVDAQRDIQILRQQNRQLRREFNEAENRRRQPRRPSS